MHTLEGTLQLLQELSEGGSDGGEVSDFRDEDWRLRKSQTRKLNDRAISMTTPGRKDSCTDIIL